MKISKTNTYQNIVQIPKYYIESTLKIYCGNCKKIELTFYHRCKISNDTWTSAKNVKEIQNKFQQHIFNTDKDKMVFKLTTKNEVEHLPPIEYVIKDHHVYKLINTEEINNLKFDEFKETIKYNKLYDLKLDKFDVNPVFE